MTSNQVSAFVIYTLTRGSGGLAVTFWGSTSRPIRTVHVSLGPHYNYADELLTVSTLMLLVLSWVPLRQTKWVVIRKAVTVTIYTNNLTSARFTHVAFISLQFNLNDSINREAISGIHFMAGQTVQPGAHYGKGMCVLMSTSCHPAHTHSYNHSIFSPRPASLQRAGVHKQLSKQGRFLCSIRQWGAKL